MVGEIDPQPSCSWHNNVVSQNIEPPFPLCDEHVVFEKIVAPSIVLQNNEKNQNSNSITTNTMMDPSPVIPSTSKDREPACDHAPSSTITPDHPTINSRQQKGGEGARDVNTLLMAAAKRSKDDHEQPSKRTSTHISSQQLSSNEPALSFNLLNRYEIPHNRTFHRRQWESKYSLKHNLASFVDLTSVSEAIDDFYSAFMEEYLNEAMFSDRITVAIDHHSLNPPIYINFLRKDFNREAFSERLKALTQSNRDLLEDGDISVTVRLIKNIGGEGGDLNRMRIAPKTLNDRTREKQSVVEIKNTDNLCGLRAILLGKLRVDEFDGSPASKRKWKAHRQKVHTDGDYRNLAFNLSQSIGLDPSKKLRIGDLDKVQQHLGDNYRIIVVNAQNMRKVYSSPPAPKVIFLELYPDDEEDTTGQYNLITKIAAYFNRYYMCIECWHPSNKPTHICPSGCKQCSSSPACERPIYPTRAVKCRDCFRDFFGEQCLANHKNNQICSIRKKCPKCGVEFTRGDKHQCFIYHCTKCGKDYNESPHYCFLTPLKKEKLIEEDMIPKAFVFYDIESIQEKVDGRLTHFPILLVSEVVCDYCYNFATNTKEGDCSICGQFKFIFYGEKCVRSFMDYVLGDLAKKLALKKGRVLVTAHNSKGYDAHFIFRDLFSRNFTDIRPILNGNKILKIDVNNVRFLDSLSFFQLPLDTLPKTFGLDSSIIAKGMFPHRFNTRANQSYVGKLPDACFFNPELMKEKNRDEFFKWYERNKDSQWSLKDELIRYCSNDVLILRTCVMSYRALQKEMCGIDPLTRCFTLASVAMEIFRAMMLPSSFLATTPPKGYSGRHNSVEGCAWLDMIEITRNIKLSREHRVGRYFVDGFHKETGEIFEYNGCYYHGCPECFPDEHQINRVSNKCMGELLRDTKEKEEYIAALRYRVNSFWSHQLQHLSPIQQDIFEERKQYYQRLTDLGPISTRDAFFGGRTNNISFLHVCAPGEQIKYLDFTSLYPHVLNSNKFPYGHPKVIRRDFDTSLAGYFGFVKCVVLAPRDLFIPVLPLKIHNKLMFPLCYKCCKDLNKGACMHSDCDRALHGTWTTPDLKLALEMGYSVLEIVEVHHYEVKDFNIFKRYIAMFLKEKQQASGKPSWVETDEDMETYIKTYKEKEGIELDKDLIKRNEGRRFLSKLMLNSLWGRFAIRPNQTKTCLINDFSDYWNLLNDSMVQIQAECNPTEKTTLLQYRYVSDEDDEDFAVRNIAVAAFVTAYARVELYKLINRIESVREGRVLYFDTDSVIFVERDTDPRIPTGDFLGELTDELSKYGAGAKCTKFTSLGPKNYGYEVQLPDGSTKVEIKAKGIRLSAQALDIINFEKMMDMANKFSKGDNYSLSIPQFRIRSTAASHIVYSEIIEKIYRVVSDKRRLDGLSTLPYGFCLR
ncbi:uncharacterized protein LOC141857561 [Brevipalpus obovatus]|uniref:uncharacterized protein LOC141857561 n=1 Tax=Brevipalpus obovatus TaxID=246614 RepID=UPI003D9E0FFD